MEAALASLMDVTADPTGGALRVLSRRDGREILILAGTDRAIGADERLAHVSWYPSPAIAVDIAACCARYLREAHFFATPDGWHPFIESQIKTLVTAARNALNVPEGAARPPAMRNRWTYERVARLGFLAGLGWTAQKIADDPLIKTTANNVYRQAHRFGIALSDGPQGQICIRLPLPNMAVVDRAAQAARITRDAYVRRYMIAATAEPERFNLTAA